MFIQSDHQTRRSMLPIIGDITLTFFVLVLPVASLCSTDRWLHHIYVDDQTGVSDPSCWEGGYFTPCFSLNLALTGAQHYNHSTAIFLQPGQHQLYNGSETQLRNKSQLAIVGNGSEGEVVVNCKSLAGLAFVWSEGIEISNVCLFGCGVLQNSTSTNVDSAAFLEIRVALIFRDCRNVNLTKVHVIESPGTGVIMYNPLGVVNIDKSQFLHNGFSDGKEVMYGGGGLVIDVSETTSELSCINITSSNFTHNTAGIEQFVYLSLNSFHDHSFFGLGKGGGISVVFRGGALNNTVQLDNVCLASNTAQFGGGLFLGFLDNASNNRVYMDNCWLRENAAILDNNTLLSLSDLTEGGGVSINLMAGASDSNTIVISNTNFVSNKAYIGGGIAVNVLHNSYKYIGTGNTLLIDGCKFTNNTAFQGASAYFSQNTNCGQTVLSTTVSYSNFNGGYCGGLSCYRVYGLPCYGNILLESFQIILEGTVMFINSSNLSALSLRSSSIELLPQTQLIFKDNIAVNGAAIYVVDCSSIIVNHNVALIFQSNSASNLGGAIYAESCHNSGLTGVKSCFFRHANSTLHPDYWGITVKFTDNKVCSNARFRIECRNSIYVDSIKFCLWPEPLLDSHTHQTFCWTGWNYADSYFEDDCYSQLASGPAYVKNTGPTSYTIYPGECLSLEKYVVYDGWNRDITNQMSIEVDVVSGAGIVYHYRYQWPCDDNQFQVLSDYGEDYANKSILLSVHPPQFPGVLVNVTFKLCENGSTYLSIFYEGGKECQCGTLVCTGSSSFCSTCYDNANTCDVYTDKKYETCGSCADPGDGVAFNFPYFVCTKGHWYGIILVLLEIVLVLLMMIILSVLHINITSGSMNGFILYSQLVSLDLPGVGSTAWPWVPSTINTMNTKQFASVPLTVYSIWNLNFLTLVPTPFSIPSTSAAGVILLQYIKATCPLLFILVTYVWIRWYNNGYRFVVYTTRPVHQLLARFWQKFKIQPSLIDTYAGLMLLSYMQFLVVPVKTMYSIYPAIAEKIISALDLLLIVVSAMPLLLFVFPLLTILLFYHLKIFQQCLTCCKLDRQGLYTLVDAYQGCFKNAATDGSERRYFAGLYLFFRFFYFSFFFPFIILPLVMNLILLLMSFLMIGIVIILRPYKRTAHNVIDFFIFLFMTLISLFSFLDSTIPFTSIPMEVGYHFLPIIIIIIYLPCLVVTIYALCKFVKHCSLLCCKRSHHQPTMRDDSRPPQTECTPLLVVHPTTTEVTLDDDYVEDDLYADRILHPGGYNEQHVSRYQSTQDSAENQPHTPAVAYGNKSPPLRTV